ncbi:MAG: hypothetical protein GY696_02095 [Gammaproteobacteria bacterium]|nr:hypothetical protein [Gammaproteobacteria bacterium]
MPAVEKGLLQQSELDYPDNSGSFKGSHLKGQLKKIWYPKSQATPLQLSNRFDCLANKTDINSDSGDRKSASSLRKGRHQGSSNTLKSKTKSSSSQNSFNSELSDIGSVDREIIRNRGPVRIGTVASKDTLTTGTITMGTLMDIPFQSKFMLNVGSHVTFHLEYISGKPIATFVCYHNPEESSSGNQSDTYD